MPDTLAPIDPRRSWLQHLRQIGKAHGSFDRISNRHLALFVEDGDTLVVTFDRAERTWDRGVKGLPLGFGCVMKLEYSLLSLISIGRTGFHDDAVEALLRDLSRDGFFASYTQVVILGVGPDRADAALRAAQFIPGAHVLLSRPAAPISATHTDPDAPAAQGPEALANAASAHILYDPTHPSEAAQAARFDAPGTTQVSLPNTGPALDRAMGGCEAIVPLIRHLTKGQLDPEKVREILRPILRRDAGFLARSGDAAEACPLA